MLPPTGHVFTPFEMRLLHSLGARHNAMEHLEVETLLLGIFLTRFDISQGLARRAENGNLVTTTAPTSWLDCKEKELRTRAQRLGLA